MRGWRRNRERRRQTWRAWWEGHKDVHRARVAAAKARRLFQLKLDLLNLSGWRCVYCRRLLTMETLTVDHIVPKARGGNGDRANLAPACVRLQSEEAGPHAGRVGPGRFGGPAGGVTDDVPF